MRTDAEIQAIIDQIRDGVDAAREVGVEVGYPDRVVVDGVPYPFVPAAAGRSTDG